MHRGSKEKKRTRFRPVAEREREVEKK